MPCKRTPLKLDPTGIGVKRKKRQGAKGSGLVTIYQSVTSKGKKTYIVRQTYINRNGFDPETGTVVDKSKVPLEWREKLELHEGLAWSDIDETINDQNDTVVQVHATEEDEESSYSSDEEVDTSSNNVNRSNNEMVKEPSVRPRQPPTAATASAQSHFDDIDVYGEAEDEAGVVMDEQEQVAARPAQLNDLAIEFKLEHNCYDESVIAWYKCMQWTRFRHAIYAKTEPFITWSNDIPMHDFEWHKITERHLDRELEKLIDYKHNIDKPDEGTDDEVEGLEGLDDDEKVRDIPGRLLYLSRIIIDMQNHNKEAISFTDNIADRTKKFRYLPVNPVDLNKLYHAHIAIQTAVKDEIDLLSRIIRKRDLNTKSKEMESLKWSEGEWSATKTIDTGTLCDKLKNYFYEVGYKVMPKMIKQKLRALDHDIERDSMSQISVASQRQVQLPTRANVTIDRRISDNVRRNRSIFDPQLSSWPSIATSAGMMKSTGTIPKRPSFATSVNSTALPSRIKPKINFALNKRRSNPSDRLMNDIPEEEQSESIPTYDARMNITQVARQQQLQESRIGNSSHTNMENAEDQLDFDYQRYSSSMIHGNTRQFAAGGGGDDPDRDSDDEGSDRNSRNGNNGRNDNRNINTERRWQYHHTNRGGNRDHNDPNRPLPRGATDRGNPERGNLDRDNPDGNRGNPNGNPGRGNRGNDRNRNHDRDPNGNRDRDNRGNRGGRRGPGGGPGGGSSGDDGDNESQHDSEASDATQDITIEYIMDQNQTQMRMIAALLARDARSSDRQGDDEFPSVIEKEGYYRGLMSPWNVQPRTSGKKSDEVKNIQLNLPQHQNFSGKNNGSYFHWRILVIEHIHKANLPIAEKQALLRRACNLEQNDILKSIFDHTAITISTYKSVIKQLEVQWGGAQRAYNHIRNALYTAPRLNLESEESVALVKSKIDRYREHIHVHKIKDLGTGREVLFNILSNLFTERQVIKFRRDCMWLKFKEPNSLEAVSEWLGHELYILQWGSQTYSKVLVRPNEKPQHKRLTHCVTAENSVIEAEECQVLTTSTSISRPESSGTAMVTEAAGGEPPAGTREESSDDEYYSAGEEVEFEFESDDGDLCLATMMNYGPPKCVLECNEKHYLSKCPIFLKLEPRQRADKIISLKRCLNCLNPNHKSKECKSKSNCSKCNRRHNSALCYAKIKKKER